MKLFEIIISITEERSYNVVFPIASINGCVKRGGGYTQSKKRSYLYRHGFLFQKSWRGWPATQVFVLVGKLSQLISLLHKMFANGEGGGLGREEAYYPQTHCSYLFVSQIITLMSTKKKILKS